MAGTTTRTIGRSLVAMIGLTALAPFAAAPAAGFGAGAVAVEPIVGPELPVSYPVLGTPQWGVEPAVAFGGSVYLTAWRDYDRGIVVARVDRAGTVLDLSGIQLSDSTVASKPAVAFDGANFLVAFEGDDAIFARRVSPDGVVLDDADIRVSSGAGFELDPAIDFDGTNYFVVWTDFVDGRDTWEDIYGARVSPGGAVLDPADLPIMTAAGNQSEVDVAFNGTDHLVVWTDYGPDWDVRGTVVTTSGTTPNPLGFPVSDGTGDQYRSAVAALGTSFFVTWEDQRTGEIPDVYAARIDQAGTVLDPSGIPISPTAGYEAFPEIVSDGTNVLVVFASSRAGGGTALYGTRVNRAGTVLDPAGVALPTAGIESALAFDGDHFFLVGWTADAIRGARLTRTVAVLDPDAIAISMGANSQSGPEMAFDGTDTLVVWSDDRPRDAGPGLYGARVGPDGQVRDGTGFPIATAADGSDPRNPSVAFDGTNYLVTWLDRQTIRAATVTRAGDVLDRFDVHVSTDSLVSRPVVAFGGEGFLVAWYASQYIGGGGSRHELRAARVTMDREVLDPSGFPITGYTTTSDPGTIDVAFGSTNFTVVWDGPGPGGQIVRGARVMTQDPGPVPVPVVFPISTAGGGRSAPRIAWNGVTHLVVWAASTAEGRPSDIYGARVDDSGTVLDPSGIPISTAPGGQQTPTVAANGPFLVTWTDRRRGLETEADLYATRVNSDGTVGHPDGFAVATSVGTGALVTAAPGPADFSVGYERFVADEPYWSTRAFIRHVSPK